MTIETKLNVGDSIFFIHEQKVIESKIRRIRIEASDMLEIIYLCNSDPEARINLKVAEEFAFNSKEKLLKSL